MHRHCIIIGLLLASPALARADLRFTRPAVDLGELRGGPAYQHRFDFVNADDAKAEARHHGQQNGARTWQARVQYREGNATHETTLLIGATLRNEVTVEPSILALTVATTVRQEVTITDHRALPMKITAVTASSPAIRVSTQAVGNGLTKVTLEVSGATLTAARQEATIDIYTDDPLYRQLQVPITLARAARAEVSATPDKVEMHGSGSKLVRLRAVGDQPVRIERADADHPAIQCTWASGPGNDATLKISVNADQRSGVTALASVRVRLTEPSARTLTIPVEMRKE